MIANPEILIQNLEYLGETLFADFWRETQLSRLERDWWAALVFACDHIFFQGRGNPLSQRYRNHAVAVLQNQLHLSTGDNISESCLDEAYARLRAILPNEQGVKDYLEPLKGSGPIRCQCASREFNGSSPLLNELCPHLGTHGTSAQREALRDRLPLNTERDVLMLTGFLRFVAESTRHQNIFNFLAGSVRCAQFKEADASLGDLYRIKEKIKPFLIRDMYLLLRRDGLAMPVVDDDEWASVFPVDTWVRTVAEKLGCPPTGSDTAIKNYFVRLCRDPSTRQVTYDPAKVAAGLFFVGNSSLDILTNQILPQVDLRSSGKGSGVYE